MIALLLPLAQDSDAESAGRVFGTLLVPALIGLGLYWLLRRRGWTAGRAAAVGVAVAFVFLLLIGASRVADSA